MAVAERILWDLIGVVEREIIATAPGIPLLLVPQARSVVTRVWGTWPDSEPIVTEAPSNRVWVFFLGGDCGIAGLVGVLLFFGIRHRLRPWAPPAE